MEVKIIIMIIPKFCSVPWLTLVVTRVDFNLKRTI